MAPDLAGGVPNVAGHAGLPRQIPPQLRFQSGGFRPFIVFL